MYLDGGRGPRGWVATDLAAVLTGPLLVVELQLLSSAAMVVPHRLHLLRRGLTQQLRTHTRKHSINNIVLGSFLYVYSLLYVESQV